MIVLDIHQIKKTLSGPMPGFEAQRTMMPRPRQGTKSIEEVEDTCLKAGVLILLYPVEGRLHLVLTKRTEHMENHRGQISFPGGRQDEGETLRETALRESYEELSVNPDALEILGDLTPLYIPPSQYCIYPTVAYTERRPDFHPSPDEVAGLMEVPLDDLLDPSNIREEVWTIRGRSVEVPFYLHGQDKIWGATAMVLAEFVEILKISATEAGGAYAGEMV